MIDNSIRDKLLRIYMDKCILQFGIKLNKWRILAYGAEKGLTKAELDEKQEIVRKKE